MPPSQLLYIHLQRIRIILHSVGHKTITSCFLPSADFRIRMLLLTNKSRSEIGFNACALSISHISLCSLHRLIRDDNFRVMVFFVKGSLFLAKIQFRRRLFILIILCGLHMLIRDDTLRTCIKSRFPRTKYSVHVLDTFMNVVFL